MWVLSQCSGTTTSFWVIWQGGIIQLENWESESQSFLLYQKEARAVFYDKGQTPNKS